MYMTEIFSIVFWLTTLVSYHVAGWIDDDTSKANSNMNLSNRFLYFAYGSNLLAQRIHINNPTAERITIGKLKDYRLDFNYWSKRWGGCAATVAPDKTKFVWGAVWSIDNSDLASLDRQEGVENGIYIPIEVLIETPQGEKLNCRSYQLSNLPPSLQEGGILPTERRPSEIYWQVIVQGAKESGLPASYIDSLEKIPHNGFKGNTDVNVDINIPLEVK